MVAFTGHRLDAVVVLTVDDEEIVAAAAAARPVEGRADDTEDVIRRRQEVYAEQTEPLIEVYRERGHRLRDRRHGRGRRGHQADLRRPRRRTPELSRIGPDGPSRPRRRDQDARADRPDAASPACSSGETLELLRAAVPARGHHRRARRASPRTTSARTAACRRSRATATRRSRRTICASVNDEVVHGIPGGRVLVEGDVISIDCGAIVDGWHGDAAITVAVGEVPPDVDRADAGHRGVAVGAASPPPASAAGSATSPTPWRPTSAAQGDYGILEDYVGHGIGTEMHHAAQRAQRRPPRPRPQAGRRASRSPSSRWSPSAARTPTSLDDDWTVVTADGSRAAHFEHTFTLTPERRLGAHRPRRRRGAARRARRPVRRPLTIPARFRPDRIGSPTCT